VKCGYGLLMYEKPVLRSPFVIASKHRKSFQFKILKVDELVLLVT
jgi:hypothetical protein